MKQEQKRYIAKGYQIIPFVFAIICLAVMFVFTIGAIVIMLIGTVDKTFEETYVICWITYSTVGFISIIIFLIERKVILNRIIKFKDNGKYDEGLNYLQKVSKNIFLFPHYDLCNEAKGVLNMYLDKLDDAIESFSQLDLTKHYTQPILQIKTLFCLYLIFFSRNEHDKALEIENLYIKRKERIQKILSDKRFEKIAEYVRLMDAFLQGNQAEMKSYLLKNKSIPLYERLLNNLNN